VPKITFVSLQIASLNKGMVYPMYAIIVTGGKQYKVEAGDVIYVEKLGAEEESEYTFDKVIAVGTDDGIKVGAPYVDGASVSAKVIKNGKSKKVTVMTYKAKKNEKRNMGHRQPYTKVEISSINA
jgi:large subunit ribosomal protein L21